MAVSIEIRLNAMDLGSGAQACTDCAFSTMKKGYFMSQPKLHCLRYVTPITGDTLPCVEVRNDPGLCGANGVGFQWPGEWDGFIEGADKVSDA